MKHFRFLVLGLLSLSLLTSCQNKQNSQEQYQARDFAAIMLHDGPVLVENSAGEQIELIQMLGSDQLQLLFAGDTIILRPDSVAELDGSRYSNAEYVYTESENADLLKLEKNGKELYRAENPKILLLSFYQNVEDPGMLLKAYYMLDGNAVRLEYADQINAELDYKSELESQPEKFANDKYEWILFEDHAQLLTADTCIDFAACIE